MTLWNKPRQAITSAGTCLNQVAASAKRINWQGGVNADIGGGRYDKGTAHLATLGVASHVYDPWNRSDEDNAKAVASIANGQSSTATCFNVLNVIPETRNRDRVIRQCADAVGDDGTAYFQTYEGNGSGKAAASTKGWQENRKTPTYVSEISKRFRNVTRRGALIVANNRKG